MRMLSIVMMLWATGIGLNTDNIPISKAEAVAGWVALFDGESTYGWLINGHAAVRDSALELGAASPVQATTTTAFGPCAITLAYRLSGPRPARLRIGLLDAPLIATPENQFRTCRFVVGIDDRPEPVTLHVPGGSRLLIRSLKLRPLQLMELPLDQSHGDWRRVGPDTMRVTVDGNGTLQLAGAKGELQSRTHWSDFILQFDALAETRGTVAGVAFRCIPGQAGSGYKCHIRNQWSARDRNRPVDYGTGGIYYRQPARRVLGEDGEWFTETVVATGRHIAVWVNGIQVCDYTDGRPIARRERQGCRLAAGPISLRLDSRGRIRFRRLRIRPLP